jgi:hypothetical protein
MLWRMEEMGEVVQSISEQETVPLSKVRRVDTPRIGRSKARRL